MRWGIFLQSNEFSSKWWHFIKVMDFHQIAYFYWSHEFSSKWSVFLQLENFDQWNKFSSKWWIAIKGITLFIKVNHFHKSFFHFHQTNGISSEWSDLTKSDEFSSKRWISIKVLNFHESDEFSSKLSIFIQSDEFYQLAFQGK